MIDLPSFTRIVPAKHLSSCCRFLDCLVAGMKQSPRKGVIDASSGDLPMAYSFDADHFERDGYEPAHGEEVTLFCNYLARARNGIVPDQLAIISWRRVFVLFWWPLIRRD